MSIGMSRRRAFVAVIVVMAGCSGSPAPPSAPATASAAQATATSSGAIDMSTWIEFVSPRHLYAISHPPDWEVIPATTDDGPRAISPSESDAFDRLRGDGFTFAARSYRIPGDSQDVTDWIDAYAADLRSARPACFPPIDAWPDIAIVGYYDGPYVTGCESIAVVGGPGRAWEFRLIGDPNPALFSDLLSWVDIDDENLVEP
jgi:hypothetical protein